ncbi:unnamed protein product, partial [Eruca vesicaria subsp. sativa]|nr:unnamed protein product [Eruca vesicaria subsp. sativa]
MVNSHIFLSDLKPGRCSNNAKVTLTQGSIAATRQLYFRERLREGSRNPNFRLCDAPLLIKFNDGTYIEKIHALQYLNSLIPGDNSLLSAIRSTITDRIPGAQRVMLTLRLQSGENVVVSMFDSMALAFHTKFEGYGKEPKIVVATSLNPKIVC